MPAQTVASQLGLILDEQRRLFVGAVERCRERMGRARVHQLRTHSRKLLASLELAEALGGDSGAKTSKRVKRALSALSPLRDVQVQLKALQVEELRGAELAARLASALKRRERELKRHGRRTLLALPLRKIDRRIARAARALAAQAGGASELALVVLRGELAARHRVVEQERAVVAADAKQLHRARLTLKRYRYALGAMEPLLPVPTVTLAEQLSQLQDRLGEAHDAAVLLDTARRAVESEQDPLLSMLEARQVRTERDALDALAGAELTFPLPASGA